MARGDGKRAVVERLEDLTGLPRLVLRIDPGGIVALVTHPHRLIAVTMRGSRTSGGIARGIADCTSKEKSIGRRRSVPSSRRLRCADAENAAAGGGVDGEKRGRPRDRFDGAGMAGSGTMCVTTRTDAITRLPAMRRPRIRSRRTERANKPVFARLTARA